MTLDHRSDHFDGHLGIHVPYSKDFLSVTSGEQVVVAEALIAAGEAIRHPISQIEMAKHNYDEAERSAVSAMLAADAVYQAADNGDITKEQAREFAVRLANVNLGQWGSNGSDAHLLYLGGLEDLGRIDHRADAYYFNSQHHTAKRATPFGRPEVDVA